jgi:hypothetical protein
MWRVTDLLGLGSAACATAAALRALPGLAGLGERRPRVALAAALALSLVPLGSLPAAGYVRGVVGDLSVTTTLLLLHHLLRPALGLPVLGRRSRTVLQALAAAGGLLLYPAVLGFGRWEPYRAGFAGGPLLWVILLLSVLSWLGRLHFAASCLALAVLAWASSAAESRNLWDYALDPLAAAWGTGALLARLSGWLAASGRRRLSTPGC